MRRRDLLAAAGGLAFGTEALGQDALADDVATELITFQSRGRAIRAAVFHPGANANGAGVVYMHGSGGIGGIQLSFARRFAEAGYIAVAPTYLDAAEDDNVRAERIMDAWRDCGSDAVEWLIGQGVDRSRTGIVGYSLGSYIAVDGALGNSRAAAAIGIAGGWDVYIPRVPARRIPVLIIRAERDTHVRPSSTERWRQFLLDHDASVRVQTIPDAPHLMNNAQWDEVSRRSVAFFDRTIARAS